MIIAIINQPCWLLSQQREGFSIVLFFRDRSFSRFDSLDSKDRFAVCCRLLQLPFLLPIAVCSRSVTVSAEKIRGWSSMHRSSKAAKHS